MVFKQFLFFIVMIMISLELMRINPNRNIFSIKCGTNFYYFNYFMMICPSSSSNFKEGLRVLSTVVFTLWHFRVFEAGGDGGWTSTYKGVLRRGSIYSLRLPIHGPPTEHCIPCYLFVQKQSCSHQEYNLNIYLL